MLVRHGHQTIAIRKIVAPGDIKQRQTQAHVIALAESYRATGGQPLSAPVIDVETRRVVAGNDRLAALLLTGLKTIDVACVSGDARELARATIIENLRRRNDDQTRLARDLVDLEEGRLRESDLEQPAELPKPGRPRTKRGQSRKTAAQASGKSEDAIARADRRVTEEQESAVADGPCIRVFRGVEVPAGILERAAKDIELLGKMSSLCRELAKLSTHFESSRPEEDPTSGQQRRRWREHLETLASTIRSTIPETICPYCKALDAHRPGCAACHTLGYSPRRADVPAELLLDGDEAGIYVRGEWTSLAETGF